MFLVIDFLLKCYILIRNTDNTRKEDIFSVIITINAAISFHLYSNRQQVVAAMADETEGSTGDEVKGFF